MKSSYRFVHSTLSAALFALVGVVVGLPVVVHAVPGQESATSDTRPAGDPSVEIVANGRDQGRINYSAGVVKATGYGAAPTHADSPGQARLMARGAAIADALRTLAMTVSSIQVTADTKVKNYVLKNDTVETHLNAFLQSATIVDETYLPDGTAKVTMSLPMYGKDSVAAVILPEVLPPPVAHAEAIPVGHRQPPFGYGGGATYTAAPPIARSGGFGAGADANNNFAGPATPATRIEPAPVSVDERPWKERTREPGLTLLSDNGPFTSVIVDCRELNIESIMSPKLMDTTGREVYGTVHVTPEYAIETGIVGYPRSMRDALRTARCGGHPLIVRAVRAADPHRFNPVISLEDADRILAANNHDHFLEQTRVIFLVDPIR